MGIGCRTSFAGALFLALGCSSGAGRSAPPDAGRPALASCTYVNPFSQGNECKDYTGSAWTLTSASTDCEDAFPGVAGTFQPGVACSYAAVLGTCLQTKDDGTTVELVSAGADAAKCSGAETGCTVFGGGVFTPGNTCAGSVNADGGDSTNVYGSVPFVQPYRVCKDPLPGEPPGHSDGGQVCTWTLISGSTEEGRHYQDYASCADVLTNRPYYPVPPEKEPSANAPRLSDTSFMTEVNWARSQVEASACVCCHQSSLAPRGAANWRVDGPGVWLDTLGDDGLAMMAGLAPSDALGAYPAELNNGFNRTDVGVPTTDVERMRRLLVSEWMRRGHSLPDAADVPAFGGPLVDQQQFSPATCTRGEGVAADGTVTWAGGSARYVYVLPTGSKNPGVPPNLDEPAGTVWFVDVPNTAMPISSGIRYGQVTGTQRQRLPATGQPAALVPGTTYYLYVLKDVGFPITRCLFTTPS